MAELFHAMGYSLQANQKTLEGTRHADRNAHFERLNGAVQQQLWAGEPSISVDTKKKELIGPFKNGGRELRPKGERKRVGTAETEAGPRRFRRSNLQHTTCCSVRDGLPDDDSWPDHECWLVDLLEQEVIEGVDTFQGDHRQIHARAADRNSRWRIDLRAVLELPSKAH